MSSYSLKTDFDTSNTLYGENEKSHTNVETISELNYKNYIQRIFSSKLSQFFFLCQLTKSIPILAIYLMSLCYTMMNMTKKVRMIVLYVIIMLRVFIRNKILSNVRFRV